MKYLFLLFFSLFLFSCTINNKVFWCGDHACINNNEKEEYFKKTMIVEVRNYKDKKIKKSEFDLIKEKIGLDTKQSNKTKNALPNKRTLTKQKRLEEEIRIKEAKEIVKNLRIEKKRRQKEEKLLAKEKRLEKKKKIKEQKKLAKQARLEKINDNGKSNNQKSKKNAKITSKKQKVSTNIEKDINIASLEFDELKDKIIKKNMFKPYPNINQIPN